MATSKTIYVFRCGATALYALTVDSTGQNLPSIGHTGAWRFEQSLKLGLDDGAPKQELIKATLAAIATHGFHLMQTAIDALPLASFCEPDGQEVRA